MTINKIGLVITCCNQVEYTKAAVHSIKTKLPFELIIIDDYSIDGTKAWLKELAVVYGAGLTVISDADTDSLGQKWNLGASKAKELGCDAVLICNNDILFSSHTIDNLVFRLNQARENNEYMAVVSANNQRGRVKPEEIFSIALERSSEAEHPDFSCFLLDLTAWEAVGKFSEEYKPCYFEDNDFHTKLKLYGYKAIATTEAPYYHYGSVTQNSVEGGLCKGPQFEYNRALFVAKFGALPDQINVRELRHKFGIIPVTAVKATV